MRNWCATEKCALFQAGCTPFEEFGWKNQVAHPEWRLTVFCKVSIILIYVSRCYRENELWSKAFDSLPEIGIDTTIDAIQEGKCDEKMETMSAHAVPNSGCIRNACTSGAHLTG